MSRFEALASPPSSRSSSVEREEDVVREVEKEEAEEQESNKQKSETKKDVRPEEKVVEKDSDKISLHLGNDKWSPIHRINGYPWRLHLYCKNQKYFVEVHCDKSAEAELWNCTASIEMTSPFYKSMEVEFNSWGNSYVLISSSDDKQWKKMENERNRTMRSGWWPDRLSHVVKITPKEDGNRWTRRQALNLSEPRDGVIKIGEEQKEIEVHREFLAANSPFFMKRFFENYKTADVTEISIENEDFETFAKMIRILYDVNSVADQKYHELMTATSPQFLCSLSYYDCNVLKLLELSWRFELKIVEDRCISFLLSNSCSMPIHERLVMSEQLNLQFLTENLLKQFTRAEIANLHDSGVFDQITRVSLKVLFMKGCVDAFGNGNLRTLEPTERITRDPASNNEPSKISWTTSFHDSKNAEYFYELNQLEKVNETVQSPITRINGFPWYLRADRRIERSNNIDHYGYPVYVEHINVHLICDKTKEAELWKCAATITHKSGGDRWNDTVCCNTSSLLFSCWESSHSICTITRDYRYMTATIRDFSMEVNITTDNDGNSYIRRPTLDPLEGKDGILVFEEEEKKIEVNKQSLADYSPYFDRLFFGSYMEKTMTEIPIGGIKYTEFYNIMQLLYGSDKAHFHCKNARRMLELADRLLLEILKDRAVALLLSPSSAVIPMPKKLLIADQYFLPFLMDGLISQLKSVEQLRELSESQEWLDFKRDTHRLLFQKFCI